MPGIIAGLSGFTDRSIGKGIVSASWLNRIGKGGVAAAGGGCISAQLSAAGVGNGADTTIDTLMSLTLPPNVLDIPGRNIEVIAWGNVSTVSSTLKNVFLTWGAAPGNASIQATAQWALTAGGNWMITLNVWKTAANVQIGMATIDSIGAGTARAIQTFNAGTELDTAAIKILLTGQSTSAATANLVTANGLVVYGYN